MESFRITFTANEKRQFLQRDQCFYILYISLPPPMLQAGSMSYPCDDTLYVGGVLRGFPTGTPAQFTRFSKASISRFHLIKNASNTHNVLGALIEAFLE